MLIDTKYLSLRTRGGFVKQTDILFPPEIKMLVFKDSYKYAVFSILAKQTAWFFKQGQGTFFLKIVYVHSSEY